MNEWGMETSAVRNWPAGHAHRPLSAPLYLSSVWEAESASELARLFNCAPDDGFYTRFGHPTLRIAEEKIAGLEGAEDGLVFASGMGAISCAILSELRGGDHVVAQRSMFGQTIRFLRLLETVFGVEVTFVDPRTEGTVRGAIRPNTRLVYVETPSNPNIDIVDISGVVQDAGSVPVFVDSTFAGPLIQRPLSLGAALVIHSASKSLAGHGDVLAGALAGDAARVARIRTTRTLLGPTLGPHACWLLLRSLQTLPLRVEAQSRRASAVAALLSEHPEVRQVFFPFQAGSAWETVARRQMRMAGGMISFTLRGGIESARRFVGSLRLVAHASSLGHVYTTVELPEDLDFSEAELGAHVSDTAVPQGLIRLSVGLEDLDDLVADVRSALAAVARAATPA